MRLAKFSDLPLLVDLVGRLVVASCLPMQVDVDHTRAVLRRLMISDDGAVWVTGAGFLAASIERTVVSPNPVAFEHGWYAEDRSGLRLLRAFEAWAAARGAVVRLSTGINGPDLSRLGYRPVEMAWVK